MQLNFAEGRGSATIYNYRFISGSHNACDESISPNDPEQIHIF